MADSALEGVIDYVHQLLSDSGEDDLQGIEVLWGPPSDDERPVEFVAVGFGLDGNSGDVEREWGPLGQQRLDEEIRLPISVESSIEGNPTNKELFHRSTAIAAAVEREIRSDITAGDSLLKGGRIVRGTGRYFRLEQRGHRVFLTFTGTARI